MANDTGDLIDAADLESPNLNPAYSLDPTYGIRAVPLTTKQVFPETSSALLAPLSTTYTPPGTRVASLAPAPGQPVNLMQGADLSVSQPRVAPVIPAGSIAPPVLLAQSRSPQQPVIGTPSVTAAPNAQAPQPAPSPGDQEVKDNWRRDYRNPDFNPVGNELQNNLNQALKQEKDLVQDTGNWTKFWNKSIADDAETKLPAIRDKIKSLREQISQQNTTQALAKNLQFFTPVDAHADNAAVIEHAVDEVANQGNIGTYMALQATPHADRVKGYTDQFMSKAGKDVEKAAPLFQKLEDATNQNDYERARNNLLNGAKDIKNSQFFGMTPSNIPLKREEFDKNLAEGNFKKAFQMVNGYKRQQADLSLPQTLSGPAGEAALNGSVKVDGTVSNYAKPVSIPWLGGTPAVKYENSTNDLGDYTNKGKWNSWGLPEKKEAAKMISENPEIKGVLDQNNMAVKFHEATSDPNNYKDSQGRTLIADAAAGTFRNISELSRAAGNIGLIRVWEHELGLMGSTMNKIYSNYGQYMNWLHQRANGEDAGEPPEMEARTDEWSPDVIAGFKRIGKFNLDKSNETLERTRGVIDYIGAHAGNPMDVGFSRQATEHLKPIQDQAEQSARLEMDKRDRIIYKGRWFELPDIHSIPADTPGFVPAGSYAKSINSIVGSRFPPMPNNTAGNVGRLTPDALAAAARARQQQPPSPPAAVSPFTGGGTSPFPFAPNAPAGVPVVPPPAPQRRSMLDMINPISTAHAEEAPPVPVNLPGSWGVGGGAAPAAMPQPAVPAAVQPQVTPGFEPQSYKAGLGRGESNNNYAAPPPRNEAGEQLSSASGKYQMVDKTWNRVKPPGATAMRAMDATPAQQEAANDHLIIENSNALTKAGLPVNNFTMSVAHQLGAGKGGASSLLTAPDGDTALKYVDREAAKNNPKFFWEGGNGRLLTVAESKAKYASFYQTGGAASPKPLGDMTLSEMYKEARERKAAGLPQRTGEADRSGLQRGLQHAAADVVPAALQTGGQIVGGAVGGPAGAMAGGAIGRAIGDPARDYLSGDLDKQDASSLALSGLGGAVEGGIQSLPVGGVTGGLIRTGGASAVAGLTDYLQTNDPKHAINKGISTGVGTAAGELAGAGINKVVAPYLERLPIADHGPVKNAAEVIATQKAVTIDAKGNQVGNPAYMTAEGYLRSKGIDPKRIAADYEATAKGSTEFGPAVIKRPAEAARLDAAHELQQVPNAVGAAHANTPMGQRAGLNARIGRDVVNPVDAVVSDTNPHGTIPRGFEKEAKTAQDEMFKPSTNYGQAIDNMATARTHVLEEIRKTQEIPREAGKDYAQQDARIRGLTAISDHIRTQQETIIKHTLPPAQADALIEHLHQAGERYAKAMDAGRKDIIATIAKGGPEGTDAKNAFMGVAKNDPTAQRWMNAMVEAEKNKGGKGRDLVYILGTTAVGVGAIPYIGTPAGKAVGAVAATVGLSKLKSLWDNYMTMKAAGKMVNFDQLVRNNVTPYKQNIQSAASTLGGTVGGDVGDELARKKPTVQNRGARVPVSR
jgi:hypothetical protein